MNPLTEQQLLDLGFNVYYKTKKGQKVFDYCEYINYCFYAPPTFQEIILAVMRHSKARAKEEVKDKILQNLLG